jgi:hypothetical protein
MSDLDDTDNSINIVIIDDLKYVDYETFTNLKNSFDLLKQGLEYYAYAENWGNHDEDYENSVINRRDLEPLIYKLKNDYWLKINTGGRTAREFLKIAGFETNYTSRTNLKV